MKYQCDNCNGEIVHAVLSSNASRQRFCSLTCKVLAAQRWQVYNWRQAHPDRYKVQRDNRTAKVKSVLVAAKDKPCADCGLVFPSYIMDFDHVRGEKKFNIGHNAFNVGWKALNAEIAKCDVVCANCHRERTHKRKAD